MSQFHKFAMMLGLGLVTVSTGTGCATTVEEPVDEQAMTADDTAESSEALTTGHGGFRRGGFRNFGPGRGLALGRRFGNPGLGHFHGGYGYGGFYDHFEDFEDDYGYGGYGYGGYGYGGYGGYGQPDINIIVEQNNGPGYGDDYGPDYGPDYGDDDYDDEDYYDDDDCDAYDRY